MKVGNWNSYFIISKENFLFFKTCNNKANYQQDIVRTARLLVAVNNSSLEIFCMTSMHPDMWWWYSWNSLFLKVWIFLRKCLVWNVLKAGCWLSETKMGSHAFQPNGPPIHLGVQMWTRQPILCHERIHWIPILANTSSLFPLRNSVDEISRPIDSIVVQRIVLQNGRNTLKTWRCVFVLSLTPRQMFLKSS